MYMIISIEITLLYTHNIYLILYFLDVKVFLGLHQVNLIKHSNFFSFVDFCKNN